MNEKKEYPPGYRFHPSDFELSNYYLLPKVHSQPFEPGLITDVKLYDHHPAELARKYKETGEKTWYFFTPRDRKYQNGMRPNRAAKKDKEGQGYWKATGKERPIQDPITKKTIALKKSLVYYEGKPGAGEKTDWIMQEYTVKELQKAVNKESRAEQSQEKWSEKQQCRSGGGESDMRLDDWVLCKIYRNQKGAHKLKRAKKQEEDGPTRKRYCIGEDIKIKTAMETGLDEPLEHQQLNLRPPPLQVIRPLNLRPPPLQVIGPSSVGIPPPPMQLNRPMNLGPVLVQQSAPSIFNSQAVQLTGPQNFCSPSMQVNSLKSFSSPPVHFGYSRMQPDQQKDFGFTSMQPSFFTSELQQDVGLGPMQPDDFQPMQTDPLLSGISDSTAADDLLLLQTQANFNGAQFELELAPFDELDFQWGAI